MAEKKKSATAKRPAGDKRVSTSGRRKGETKNQRIPAFGAPMTAAEKEMWREYDEAQKSKTPESALAAWARKHNVQLKGKNRVEIVKTYKRAGAAPERTTAATAQSCRDICGISKFERWEQVGARKMVMRCSLSSCEYDRDTRSWNCFYTCLVGIRLG